MTSHDSEHPLADDTNSLVSAVPDEVAADMRRLLGDRADRVLAHLGTSAWLILQLDEADVPGLRLSESVAYNLREALDSVAAGIDPAEGGLSAIHAAWTLVETARTETHEAQADALAHLNDVVERSTRAAEREGYRTRQLLQHVRTTTGVDPLNVGTSVISQYGKLRQAAAGALHSAVTPDEVRALYNDAVGWLVAMFTPPDRRAEELIALAHEPFTDAEQLDRLTTLCTNPLQLGLFLSAITDSGWLTPLREKGFITLPAADGTWPLHRLNLASTHPTEVADLLTALIANLQQHTPIDERASMAFSILRQCLTLGAAGHTPAVKIINTYGAASRAIRVLAVDLIRSSDPAAAAVENASRVVLNAVDGRRENADSTLNAVLTAIVAGLTPKNTRKRALLVAHALKKMSDNLTYHYLDSVALTAPKARIVDVRLFTASHLLTLLNTARAAGTATSDLLEWVAPVPGDLSQRLTSRILIGAADIPMSDKLNHIAGRLTREPTGDDRDLINDIVGSTDADGRAAAAAVWAHTFGAPPDGDTDPDDPSTQAATVWRWMSVLPEQSFAAWTAEIAPLIAARGVPDPARFDTPIDMSAWQLHDQSPIASSALADLSAEGAATAVASWQPDPSDPDPDSSRRKLDEAYGQATEQRLSDWAPHADAVVKLLTDQHTTVTFVRVLAYNTTDPANHPQFVTALIHILDTLSDGTWPAPTPTGDGAQLVKIIADLTEKVARTNTTTLTDDQFERLWNHTTAAVAAIPPDYERTQVFSHDPTALTAAINTTWGKNLEAALALATHRYHASGETPPDLTELLDRSIAVHGDAGDELRAVLVGRLAQLDTLVPDWVTSHLDDLFPHDADGDTALSEFLRRHPASGPFLDRLHDRLFSLVHRAPDNVTGWLLSGAFWDKPGFEIDTLISLVRQDPTAAGHLCAQTARLIQNEPADSLFLAKAVTFWRAILDATPFPAEALVRLGHWAFVDNVAAAEFHELILRTIAATGGAVEYPTDIAERWRTDNTPVESLPIVLALTGHGEEWERGYILDIALDCLRAAAATGPLGEVEFETFQRLRQSLIERGEFGANEVQATPKA